MDSVTSSIVTCFKHTHSIFQDLVGDTYKETFLATPPDGVDVQVWAEAESARRGRPAPKWTISIRSFAEMRGEIVAGRK